MCRSIVLALVAVLSVVSLAAPAVAQDGVDCASTVVDYDSVLGDPSPIVIAASDVERFGQVRVHVWNATSDGLESELSALAQACGWFDGSSDLIDDLLLVAVSVEERNTLVNYGSDWAPALDDSVDVILNRIINPQFAEGAYTAGLTVGLEQIAARRGEVDGVERTTTTASPTTTQPTDGATETTIPVQTPPESTPETTTFLLPDLPTSVEEPSPDPVPESVPDAEEEVVESTPTSIVAAPPVEDPADVAAAADEAGEAQLVPNLDQDNSGVGVYVLIAAVLAAVFIVPAVILRRNKNEAES